MADKKMNEFDLAAANQTDISKVYVENTSGAQKRANIADLASVVGGLLDLFPIVNINMTAGNLDDCTAYGFYATANASNLVNKASNGQYAFWLTFGYAVGQRYYQVYFDMSNYHFYGRRNLGTTWTDWVQFS